MSAKTSRPSLRSVRGTARHRDSAPTPHTAERWRSCKNTTIMKNIMLTVALSLLSILSYGTAQIPDLIIYKGDTLSLYSCPLNEYPDSTLLNPQILFGGKGCFYTACWRNYVATWEIINNELFLIEIRNACYPTEMRGVSVSYKSGVERETVGTEYADLKALFLDRIQKGKVKADWVTGNLISPQGKLLLYIHDGFQSIYENELEFRFENGILIETKQWDNSKTKKSKYTGNDKILFEFIQKNIDYNNLPKSDSIKRRVIVRIVSADDNGKIDSVVIVRGVNELYNKEAIRVVKMIPEWDVVYRHGKKTNENQWSIPVMFDLRQKIE